MKVFYHNDNDGKGAAYLVYFYSKCILKEELEKNDFIEVNYNNSIPTSDIVNKDEIVFIVDYSFTNGTIDQLRNLHNKTNNIYWFDHHKSSLNIIETVRDEKLVAYSEIDVTRSGAKIVYDYIIRKTEGTDVPDILKAIEQKIIFIDDYDRWVHKYPESILFNIGSSMYDTHPMSDFWNDWTNVTEIVNNGKLLKKYKDNVNKSYCKQYAYECTINGHKCIVMNTPESSSQAFVELYDEYKFAIRYNFNGEVFKYSIYSNLEDIDCAKIANLLNPKGGGHKGAAGFVSDRLIFTKDNEYWIE